MAAKFVMRRKHVKPVAEKWESIMIYDGMPGEFLQNAINKFDDLSKVSINFENVDCWSDGGYANVYLQGPAGPNTEALERYERELADYNQWKKDNAAEIKAIADKKKKTDLDRLTAQKLKLDKEAAALAKQIEKLS